MGTVVISCNRSTSTDKRGIGYVLQVLRMTSEKGKGRPEGWRKDTDQVQTSVLKVYCTSAQAAEIKRQAKQAGKSVSAYVLATLTSSSATAGVSEE